MFSLPPFIPLSSELLPRYRRLRLALALCMFLVAIFVTHSFLFPTVTTSFDFRNPKSSKNFIFDPRSDMGTPRTNGKLEPTGRLIANTSPLGDFSITSIVINLEKDSPTPEQMDVMLQKGYRAFFLPIGDPLTTLDWKPTFRIRDTYYELRENVLHPFVSEAAYHSRYPVTHPVANLTDAPAEWNVTDQLIGFRVGSLLSFADGVYVVTSESDIRPIGSAEIFLALGYNFEDVLPVSEEDLGIYKRGRIFLMGATHPDGTLFADRDSDTLYLIKAGERHAVADTPAREFLLTQQHPILATSPSEASAASCVATPGWLSGKLRCLVDLEPAKSSLGPDYELTVSNTDTDIDISSLSLDFETRLDAQNLTTLLAKVKQRLLTRFGLAQP